MTVIVDRDWYVATRDDAATREARLDALDDLVWHKRRINLTTIRVIAYLVFAVFVTAYLHGS